MNLLMILIVLLSIARAKVHLFTIHAKKLNKYFLKIRKKEQIQRY